MHVVFKLGSARARTSRVLKRLERAIFLGVAWVSAVLGCETREVERTEVSGGSSRVGGEIVSTVDGYPVRRDEVARRARKEGISLRDALSDLQEEILLGLEAERRGFAASADVRTAMARAAAQQVLVQSVEAEVLPSGIERSAVEEFYNENKERFVSRERRGSLHFLVLLPKGASKKQQAEALAKVQQMRPRLQTVEDFGSFTMQHHQKATAVGRTIAEQVPPMPIDAQADKAYLEALFSLNEVGDVTAPVRSAFGYHVIRLTSIVPSKSRSVDDVDPEIREELVLPLRTERFSKFERELLEKRPSKIIDDAMTVMGEVDFNALESR